MPPKTNYWALLPIVGILFIGIVGFAGNIRLFTHFSAFAVLPLLVWFLLGTRIALCLWFPLIFVVFAIPVGEELIPYLQEIAADLSVGILRLTTVPVLRNGLYIEIPNGRFVVAEECSGISFLVASVVFGSLYAYISYVKVWRQLLFFALTIVVPIGANALRIVGIILVGHYTDMEHATGADHLIYGWFFFAVVLILLFFIGEMIRTKADKIGVSHDESTKMHDGWLHIAYKKPVAIAAIALISMFVWQLFILLGKQSNAGEIDTSTLAEFSSINEVGANWQTQYINPSDSYIGYLSRQGLQADINISWYGIMAANSELVSLANKLFDDERWTRVSGYRDQVDGAVDNYPVNILEITDPNGMKRLVIYWYELPNTRSTSRAKIKLHQTFDVLTGGPGAGALVAISMPFKSFNKSEVEDQLRAMVATYADSIKTSLPF